MDFWGLGWGRNLVSAVHIGRSGSLKTLETTKIHEHGTKTHEKDLDFGFLFAHSAPY
jgi:hypothetical protein